MHRWQAVCGGGLVRGCGLCEFGGRVVGVRARSLDEHGVRSNHYRSGFADA